MSPHPTTTPPAPVPLSTGPVASSTPTPSRLESTGVVAVLRAPSFDRYRRVVDTLLEAGLSCIELTLTTPNTLDGFPALRSELGGDAELGIGTVTSADLANAALDCGADFLVTPTTDASVIDTAVRRGTPVYPGAFSPTEIWSAAQLGATAVKVFPAATLGPGYVKHLHGPFPGLRLLPSGGVALADITAWINAGSVAVSLGSPLIGDAFGGEDPARLRERARTALDLVAEARL